MPIAACIVCDGSSSAGVISCFQVAALPVSTYSLWHANLAIVITSYQLLRALKMLWRWWCSQRTWLLLLLMWFMDKTTLASACLAKYLHFCEQVKSESILPSKGVCSPCNINNHLRCMGTIVEVHYKNSVFPTHLHMTFKNPMRKCNRENCETFCHTQSLQWSVLWVALQRTVLGLRNSDKNVFRLFITTRYYYLPP